MAKTGKKRKEDAEERARKKREEATQAQVAKMRRRRTLIILAVALWLIALLILIGLVSDYQTDQALADHGVTTQATIYNKTSESEGRGIFRYTIYYRIAVSTTAEQVDGRDEVGSDAYNRFQVGQQVDVRYLPENSHIIHLLDPSRVDNSTPVTVLTGMLIGMGSFSLYSGFTGKGWGNV